MTSQRICCRCNVCFCPLHSIASVFARLTLSYETLLKNLQITASLKQNFSQTKTLFLLGKTKHFRFVFRQPGSKIYIKKDKRVGFSSRVMQHPEDQRRSGASVCDAVKTTNLLVLLLSSLSEPAFHSLFTPLLSFHREDSASDDCRTERLPESHSYPARIEKEGVEVFSPFFALECKRLWQRLIKWEGGLGFKEDPSTHVLQACVDGSRGSGDPDISLSSVIPLIPN